MEYNELIKDFLDDANMHINEFDNALLALEKNGLNKEIVINTLGSLHTLKGNSGINFVTQIHHFIGSGYIIFFTVFLPEHNCLPLLPILTGPLTAEK